MVKQGTIEYLNPMRIWGFRIFDFSVCWWGEPQKSTKSPQTSPNLPRLAGSFSSLSGEPCEQRERSVGVRGELFGVAQETPERVTRESAGLVLALLDKG